MTDSRRVRAPSAVRERVVDNPPVATHAVFDRHTDHEQVVFCQDRATGLQAVIAIHSTALGPALGGTRFFPYASEDAALTDVLNLSRGMTYKAALAGLDLGGGKAVIIGDPYQLKTESLLRAYGRFVQSLGGRYITACDVGTYVPDMDVVAQESAYVTGRSLERGGSGDSSVLTALGVYEGMRAAAARAWGPASLRGRTVGVAGVGKVGFHLVGHLMSAGARVVVTDVDAGAVARTVAAYPEIGVVASIDILINAPIDVYAPCALGGALTDVSVAALQAEVVCGAANNQLAHPGVAKLLDDRGIVYAPDYVVNAGGLIQVADEIDGFDFARAQRRAAGIFDTTQRVFDAASSEGVPPSVAADRLAERRIFEVDHAARMWLAPSQRAMTTYGVTTRAEKVP